MAEPRPITILMADDDPDDRDLAREALTESRLLNELHVVDDGEQLLAFLRREGKFAGSVTPRPDLILLDLNMPRMDGREALQALKSDAVFRSIPVVILTTSRAEEDVVRSYDLGANSFISKPVTFSGLVEVMIELGRYWVVLVELPEAA
jgi:CheY-like chemotaxis protein